MHKVPVIGWERNSYLRQLIWTFYCTHRIQKLELKIMHHFIVNVLKPNFEGVEVEISTIYVELMNCALCPFKIPLTPDLPDYCEDPLLLPWWKTISTLKYILVLISFIHNKLKIVEIFYIFDNETSFLHYSMHWSKRLICDNVSPSFFFGWCRLVADILGGNARITLLHAAKKMPFLVRTYFWQELYTYFEILLTGLTIYPPLLAQTNDHKCSASLLLSFCKNTKSKTLHFVGDHPIFVLKGASWCWRLSLNKSVMWARSVYERTQLNEESKVRGKLLIKEYRTLFLCFLQTHWTLISWKLVLKLNLSRRFVALDFLI